MGEEEMVAERKEAAERPYASLRTTRRRARISKQSQQEVTDSDDDDWC